MTALPAAPAAQPVHWLLVHDLQDATAAWLAQRWRQRLGAAASQLLVLPAPALTLCTQWRLQIDGGGTHSLLRVALASGAVFSIESTKLRGVLHRPAAAWLPPATAATPDRDYMAQERQALLLAWLNGLGSRCINPPSTEGLCGPVWSAPQWRWQAQRCEMPVLPWPDPVSTSPAPLLRLLVVGNRCFSVNGAPLGPTWQAAARRLACAANCQVLGLYLVGDDTLGWHFAQADTQCDLRPGGGAAVLALAAAMDMPLVPTEPGRTALPCPSAALQPTATCP